MKLKLKQKQNKSWKLKSNCCNERKHKNTIEIETINKKKPKIYWKSRWLLGMEEKQTHENLEN